jgi:acylphosphatase
MHYIMRGGMRARRYIVRGRVQGVGFRNFVKLHADALGLEGWVRNLANGDVEAHAQGPPKLLSALEGHLWSGPRWSDVRGVQESDAAPEACSGFRIR